MRTIDNRKEQEDRTRYNLKIKGLDESRVAGKRMGGKNSGENGKIV